MGTSATLAFLKRVIQSSFSAVASSKSLMLPLLMTLLLTSSVPGQQNPNPQDSALQISPGVVVEKVVEHSEGEKAGLQKGDVLLLWSRGDTKGEIQSPFDLTEIETEQAPRGTVKLDGLRGTEKQAWTLGPRTWGLNTSPNFPGTFLTSYREGQELAKAGKPEQINKAAERWIELASQCSNSQARWLPAWLFLHTAELLKDAKQWKEADDAYQSAVRSSVQAGPLIEGQILRAWAGAYQERSDWPHAEKYFQQSIAKIESLGGGKLAIAANLNALGSISRQHGDLDKSEQYHLQALDMQEKLAPGSFPVVSSLNNLGAVAHDRGDWVKLEQYQCQVLDIQEKLEPGSLNVASRLDYLGGVAFYRQDLTKAEHYYRQALDIREKLAPGSSAVAATLIGLANVADDQGDLAREEQCVRQALDIQETLAPGSRGVSSGLDGLGMVAARRGDLVKAEQYTRQALDIQQKLATGSDYVSVSLSLLGLIESQRGDLVKAEQYLHQHLDIAQKLHPETPVVAGALNSLAIIATRRGDLASAEQYLHQALDIVQKLAPEGILVAACLKNLGDVAKQRGELAMEEAYYHQALATMEKLAPQSLDLAETVQALGDLARRSGNLGEAGQYYRQALTIREKLAPGSMEHAESLAALGSLLRDQEQPDAAAQFYAQAVSALESQTARLGGSEDTRSGFRASHSDTYREYVDLLLAQKRPNQAFEVLERSRARILLEMLLAAHVDIHKGADPSLLQQERSLQETRAAKSDRRLRLLGEKNNEKQVAAFTQEIDDLGKQYQEVEEQLRLNSPGYAALTQPQPLTASEIQQLLDPDTLLLEYSLGEKRSHVFAVTTESLTVHELPKRAELEDQAKHLYSLLTVRNHPRGGEDLQRRQARVAQADSAYVKAAAALSQVLLGGIGPELGHNRLLIVAEGALLYVPFTALPEPQSSGAKDPVPLMVGHEVVSLPSASTLAILRRERSPRSQPLTEAVILADPVFDDEDQRVKEAENRNPSDRHEQRQRQGQRQGQRQSPDAEKSQLEPPLQPDNSLTRSAGDLELLNRGQLQLPRLPFARREADAIAAVTGPQKAREALDFTASRTLAVSGALSQYRIVHFATHALVDDQHPDLSGLVLSLVDQHGRVQNGFVDLEDIYNLDLSADLVVLSACETAVGKQVDGEGMIGLTRGFMYAGASSVLGTLWSVNDFATSKFMRVFYTAMEKKRMPRAQALRQAQLVLWREKHWSAPYYWAAFTLQGDWK